MRLRHALCTAAAAGAGAATLPGTTWQFGFSAVCGGACADVDTVAAVKDCVDRSACNATGTVTLNLPRRAACSHTILAITPSGLWFDLPVNDPAFVLEDASLYVNTAAANTAPTLVPCERALRLWPAALGLADDPITGESTTSTCNAKRYNSTALAEGAVYNRTAHQYTLNINTGASMPPAVWINSAAINGCTGVDVNQLQLTFAYRNFLTN